MREADIHIPHEALAALGFDVHAGDARGAEVIDLTLVSCEGSRSTVAATYSDPVDDALAAADHVAWWERRESGGEGVAYLYGVDAPALPDGLELGGQSVAVEAVTIDEDGCTLTVVGEQERLRQSVAAYEAVDAPAAVSLRRLADYDGPASPLSSLTARQREVLETAYDLGYFEVPREASAADVARELDLDRATVTEHLQRAERNLVSSLLSG